MKKNWNDIKWIFEWDGSLLDIYVQEVNLEDWKKLIDWLNSKYDIQFGNTNQIDKDFVIKYLTDLTGEIESKSASINLDSIKVNCHFFLQNEIEFDIDPREITSFKDYERLENFMKGISLVLNNQVLLTGENNPKFPLIKIDANKQIYKILTEKEANQFHNNSNSFKRILGGLWLKFQMRFFRESFKKKLLDSASKPHLASKKQDNIW